MKPAEEKQRFALRKLSIGTVSVLVGFLAFGFSASDQVKADTGDNTTQTQVVTQSGEQPSQKAAENQLQVSTPAQQETPAAKQQVANTKQQASNQQPFIEEKVPASQPSATDPVTVTKTITRTIDEIRFTVNWNDPSNGDTIRTIYTANYKRTKTNGEDGQATYSDWIPDGSHVAVYDVNTDQQLSESTNMLDIQNGQYIFPAYVLKGTPSYLLKDDETYHPIINYTTGKNADGSYKWVTNEPLTTPDVPGETVNPNTSVDSKVEIEYLSGFNTDSNWIYNRTIYDLNPATGKFDTVSQGTSVMNHTWQEDPRQGEPGKYTFTGDSVPEYTPKHADQYIPQILVYKNNGWQPTT